MPISIGPIAASPLRPARAWDVKLTPDQLDRLSAAGAIGDEQVPAPPTTQKVAEKVD